MAFPLAALLGLAGPIIESLVERIPDPAAREKAKFEAEKQLLDAISQASRDQTEINKVEAAHSSLFVAGWRPAIGYVCCAGLAYTFVLAPVLTWALALWAPGTPLPVIETDHLFELVLAMLGLGGLRTFEKMRGVAR